MEDRHAAGAQPPGEPLDQGSRIRQEVYLGINCACFTPNEGRMDDVVRMAEEYGAQGVIHYALQFCTPYQMEARGVEKASREAGLPVLRIDTDYSMEDIGQLQTRVEAFVEMLAD